MEKHQFNSYINIKTKKSRRVYNTNTQFNSYFQGRTKQLKFKFKSILHYNNPS
jgi:hypothetical protein